ncbi:endonuclease/exonuclease/phosphatase family protein [Ignatzschineria rhizosphaerae]|uniref:Endonuclease/exonuclease/phosphatase family protein n=1 Tax=Ignatzschineria rhizosphaerae TaxID=2923279 RepID=A0ABY3WZE5_9GAMM|nr:endonuclease/exonuclease/phosphatase family protein [Ignatzschineria rhizosphaerae]UNM95997.1 endonuclease/exonuclease/phosphatase family protein [Ignatzschineria rhizosphaerae]
MTKLPLNIASCNLQNLNEHSALHKIDNFIHALSHELALPDVIALQEIGSEAVNKENFATAEVALILIEMLYAKTGVAYQYVDIAPLKNSTGGAHDFNIRPAFLIRTHIRLLQKYEIGTNDPAFTGDETLQFRPSRNPLVIIIEKGQKQLTLINCHLKSQNSRTNQEKKLAKKQRNEQALIIKEHCQQLPSDMPVVIMGDFNDTPNSDTLKLLLDNKMTSIWSQYQARLYTTKHRNCPVAIDYILLSDAISFNHPQIHHINTNLKSTYRFSDHDPISVEIYF